MPRASASTVSATSGGPDRLERARRILPVLGLCCWLLFGGLLLCLRAATVQSVTQGMEQQVAAQLDALAAAIPQQISPGKAGSGKALAAHAAALMPPAQTRGFSLRAAVLEADGSVWIVPETLTGSSPLRDELMLALLEQHPRGDAGKAQNCGTPGQNRQPLPDAALSICHRTLELMNADLAAVGLFPRPHHFSPQAGAHRLILLLVWGVTGLSFTALALVLRRDRSRVRGLKERFGLALRKKRARNRELAAIHSLMREGIVILQDGRVAHCNPSFAYGIGLEPDMVPGLDCAAFISPEDLPVFENNLQTLREGQENPPCFSLRLLTRLEDLRWASCTLTRVTWRGKEAALLCFLDLTQLKEAEHEQTLAAAERSAILAPNAFGMAVFDTFGALAKAARTLTAQAAQTRCELLLLRGHINALLDAGPSALIGVDRNLRVTFWNSMAAERFDLPPQKAVGQMLGTLDHSLARHEALVRKVLHERRVLRVSMIPCARDGVTFYEDLIVSPLESSLESGVLIRIDDVTRRMQLEEELTR